MPGLPFDWTWLLLALPLVFALGWMGSRLDLRQWRRADREAPKAYFKGLNLLLNDQPDKAIDAFIEAVQHEPDAAELHFTLGNLFRRRGEFERAVRVHQHLLQRADLALTDRQRAQHALAQDFMQAGLFDRAEAAFQALQGTPFDTEARLALLQLHERSRDWQAAADTAAQLEKAGTGSFAQRMSHYHCELALAAEERGDLAAADTHWARAQALAPMAARPLAQRAERLMRRQQPAEAWALYLQLRERDPDTFARLASEVVACAQAAGQTEAARTLLAELFNRQPGIDLARALARLDTHPGHQAERLGTVLKAQPSLSAVLDWLDAEIDAAGTQPGVSLPVRAREAVVRAARTQQRYRCAACGFEAQRHFWQCPGCLNWDSFPPQRLEEQ